MARFVESDRLWPLLAFFAGAVVVIIGADVAVDLSTAAPGTLWIVVGVWLVVTPLGAWGIWKGGKGQA
jgi:hypothetical protein